MEELEKNETSAHAEENTVSLASAQALADALAKIEVYTPTTWVDNSSPDIDAEHLNKPEQAIKRVTDALNSAVDVIKDLQSQVTKNAGDISTVNNNLSNTNERVTQLYSDLKMSQHTISMVTAYEAFATIVRQRCYIDNKSLIINVLIDIKNKDAFDEHNNILIFLNMHTEKQVIDIAGVGVGANRSIFMYAKDNAIYLNTRPEANGYYVLNCTIPFISL